MLSTFSFIGILWIFSGILWKLLQSRLPATLQGRWVTITISLSVFLLAESLLVLSPMEYLRVTFYLIVVGCFAAARLISLRIREWLTNLSIIILLLSPACSFVVFDFSFPQSLISLLASLLGCLLHLVFDTAPQPIQQRGRIVWSR